MTPFEFVIPQRPVSLQAKTKKHKTAWKNFVASQARQAITGPIALTARPLALSLLYFYDEVALDVDNILKPIQDALIGILYLDDSVISDVEIRRRWLGATFTLNEVSPTLAAGLTIGNEFVYVALRDAPPQDVLP